MIIPALLTNDLEKLQQMIIQCQTFCQYIQIDIMDGTFVPSQSVSLQEFNRLSIAIPFEVHLMVDDPLEWIMSLAKMNAQRIIFHAEIPANIQEVITVIKQLNIECGLAVNPETKIETIIRFLDFIDMVLFLSVNPGFYGAAFIPEVLAKIRLFKEKFPDMETGIDGGVKLSNVEEIARSGINRICVGSAILNATSPIEAFTQFSEIVKRTQFNV